MRPVAVIIACACVHWMLLSAFSCTIFVLTDGSRTLYFNNEDYSNPSTRIWFVPAGKDYFGCAYLGFDDNWAQGGVNTEGLAFDWVAGFADDWKPARGMKKVRGNPSQRMLESCSTVDQAIAFYQSHQEPSFARARILIADRSGASVIIGYKNRRLHIEQSTQCRGFGFAHQILARELATPPEPTLANGARILRASHQRGEFATKYSNVFDLRNGDIFLFTPGNDNEVKLHLHSELAKPPHYYDIPNIRVQLAESPRPLLNEMKRFFLDDFKPLPDQQPAITKHLRAVITEASRGRMNADHYSPELWQALSPMQEDIQLDVKKFGRLQKLALVGRSDRANNRTFRYRIDFKKASILQSHTLDSDNRITSIKPEGTEWK